VRNAELPVASAEDRFIISAIANYNILMASTASSPRSFDIAPPPVVDCPAPECVTAERAQDTARTVSFPLITSATRLPVLDGLRGVAILLVIICHLLTQLQPNPGIFKFAVIAGRLAWSGVDLFFVLSGFLIGGILLDARSSPRYYSTFYARRAFRILPIYGVLLGLFSLRYLPFHWMPGYVQTFSTVEVPFFAYVTFSQNFWMAHLGNLGVGTLSPTWSLAVEEQFYLTMPLFIRNIPRRRLAAVLVGVVAGAPILRLLLFIFSKNAANACYVLMPCRADALSLGVLAAIMVRNRRAWDFLVQERRWLGAGATVLFAGVAAFTLQLHQLSGLMISLRYSVLALFYMSCLLLALTREQGVWQSALTFPALTGLGTIAYFTYLFHIPVIEVSRRVVNHFAARPTDISIVLLAYLSGLAATFVLAALSWKYFEKPLVRKGRTFSY
jgi:peptidoglycan/LPS O-acetylase OafA/YrhL